MASFVVLQHGEERSEINGAKTIFVRDAFSVVALAFPILWLLWHKLWLAAVLMFCLLGLVSVLMPLAVAPIAMMFISFLAGLLIALEGPALRIKFAQLSGYRIHGVVEAETLVDAELKWAVRTPNNMQEANPSKPASQAPLGDLIFEGHH